MSFRARVLAVAAAAAVGSCGQAEVAQQQVAADPPASGRVSEGEAYLLILLGVVVIGGFIVLRRKD